MQFLEQLVKMGTINRYQMEDILEKAKSMNGDLDKAIEAEGIPSDVVRQAKGEFYGVAERVINFQDVSLDALKYIPEDASANYRIVPIGIKNGVLEIGMLDPGDVAAVGALQFISSKIKMPIEKFVISYDDYKKAVEGYHGVSDFVEEDSGNRSAMADEILDVPNDEIDENAGVNKDGSITEDAPATKMIGVIVKNAIDGGASDIHIEHIGTEVRVRYRVDGILHTSLRPNKSFLWANSGKRNSWSPDSKKLLKSVANSVMKAWMPNTSKTTLKWNFIGAMPTTRWACNSSKNSIAS